MSCLPWHAAAFAPLVDGRKALPHALLLHGPQGVGKLDFARALAQALLCETPAASGIACGGCPACAWFSAGTHPDFQTLEPVETEAGDGDQAADKKGGRQITIAQVRMLTDFINLSGHRGGPKVILIHPAEALNVNAANALLKSLEEPPPATHFFLVTHRPYFILPTIKSRCRQLALPCPSQAEALAWLEREKVPQPALALAQTGNAPLLATRLADRDWWDQRALLLDAIAKPGFDPLAVAERVRDIPLPNLVSWLQKWTYDLVSVKLLGAVRYNPDYADALAAGVSSADVRRLQRFHRHVVGMQRIVHHPLNPRLVIEDLLVDYTRHARGA